MKFSASILAAAALCATLAGCGQRGPLYLPPPEPAPHSSAPALPLPQSQPQQSPTQTLDDSDKSTDKNTDKSADKDSDKKNSSQN